ncbi:hypothetical protein [Kordia sp.]|uniref:hypothetical protein n=1 Tax=Kordia sp. TaxID=1965332 RepID=UPI003D6B00B1
MNWIGTKKQKESITNDGYHLLVKCIDESRYTWTVSYRGNMLQKFKNKPITKNSMPRAKRQAIRLMVYHMLKKLH